MDVGMVGLGRIGSRIARRWLRAGHRAVGFDRDASAVAELAAEGLIPAVSLADFATLLAAPRAV